MPRREIAAVAALLLGPGAAGAEGYAGAPFREDPVALARAAALERIEVAARTLAAASPAAPASDGEEGGPLADLALLRAGLAAASPDLARALGAAVEGMVEAAEAGEDASAPAAEAIALARRARAALPSGAERGPAVRAALMASLLLDEGGVAEAYEGEAGAYALGWSALRRVEELWAGLAATAAPEEASEVEEALAALDALFPGPAASERLSPDPEEAEGPSQRLVGLLEGIVDAELNPGRDLGRAAELVGRVAEEVCGSLGAGEAEAGAEEMAIAATYYAGTRRATLGLLAPEADAAIRAGLGRASDPGAAAAACGPLREALARGRAALSP